MSFPCTGCGLCCKTVGQWVTQARELVSRGLIDTGPIIEAAEFPYTFNDDGSCEMLENNKCKVYDNRPNVCSIEKTWQRHHSTDITLEEYYRKAASSCNNLITQAGIDKKFLVQL